MSKEVIVAGSLSVVFVILVGFAFLGHKSSTEAQHPSDDSAIAGPSPEGDSTLGKTGTGEVAFTGNAGGTSGAPMPVSPAIPGPTSTGGAVAPGPIALGTTAGGTTAGFAAPPPIAPVQPQHTEPIAPQPGPESEEPRTHIVAHGETLADISQQYYNTHKYWRKIVKANPGLEPDDLKEGQKIIIPPLSTVKPASAPAPAEGEHAPELGQGESLYTVQKGDSLYLIAQKQLGNPSRWTEIRTLNKLDSDELREGDQLRLPAKEERAEQPAHQDGAPAAAGGRVHVVEEGETLADISKQYYGTTRRWKDIVKANPGLDPDRILVGAKLIIPEAAADAPHGDAQAPAGAEPPSGGSTYVVKSGDSIRTIAKQTLGSAKAWKQIMDANPGIDPTRLRVGQKLHIPGGAAAPSPMPAPSSFAPAPPTAPVRAPAPTGPAQPQGGAGGGLGP